METRDGDRTFDTRSACDAYLASALGGETGPIDEGCRTAFLELCEEPARAGAGYEMVLGRWVVKFEDIGVFAAVRNAFISWGGASYVFRDLNAAGIAAVVYAVAEVLVNVYRSLGRVTSRQARILAIMKRAGEPLSVADIASQPAEGGDMDWYAPVIERELKAMQQFLIRKGSMKAVDRLEDGRWFLNGV